MENTSSSYLPRHALHSSRLLIIASCEKGCLLIECGDKVTVNGEDGAIWDVIESGTSTQIVHITKDGNSATRRSLDRAGLTLVAKAIVVGEDSPR